MLFALIIPRIEGLADLTKKRGLRAGIPRDQFLLLFKAACLDLGDLVPYKHSYKHNYERHFKFRGIAVPLEFLVLKNSQ